MRSSSFFHFVTICALGLAPFALAHCSSHNLGTPSDRDASAEGGASSSDDGDEEECATPCTPRLTMGCADIGNCSPNTICEYRCPTAEVKCDPHGGWSISPEALCGDAGLDEDSGACHDYLDSCEFDHATGR